VSTSAALPPPPRVAEDVFGPQLDQAVAYGVLLAGAGVERGLIGPREVPRLWTRHLLNCAVVSELVPLGAAVDDVGSGAGLPGIVLALARPDLRVTLVEPLQRRCTFLIEVVAGLELNNVTVVRARAEERARGRGPEAAVDVVTARAVAPLDRLATWCLPLVRPGGSLLALKGTGAADELMQAGPTLERLGAAEASIRTVGKGVVDPPTTVVTIRRGQPTAGSARRTTGAKGRR